MWGRSTVASPKASSCISSRRENLCQKSNTRPRLIQQHKPQRYTTVKTRLFSLPDSIFLTMTKKSQQEMGVGGIMMKDPSKSNKKPIPQAC